HTTNRSAEQIERVEKYCKENLMWRTGKEEIEYSSVVEFDLSTLEPTVSGPKRPQDKILVKDLSEKFVELLEEEHDRTYEPINKRKESAWLADGGSGTEFTFGKVPKSGESNLEVVRMNCNQYVLSIKIRNLY